MTSNTSDTGLIIYSIRKRRNIFGKRALRGMSHLYLNLKRFAFSNVTFGTN
jgi:hypothetical protein